MDVVKEKRLNTLTLITQWLYKQVPSSCLEKLVKENEPLV